MGAVNLTQEACAAQGGPREAAHQDLLTASQAILQQGEALLETLTDEAYRDKSEPAFHASIGGHYRHCLDHFQCFFAGLECGTIDYDQRKRDVLVEHDRAAAAAATRSARLLIESLALDALSGSAEVRCEVGYGMGRMASTGSTLARELIYVIAHTIHHYALIAMMARGRGFPLPENFGVAPSTVTYLAGRSGGESAGA